MSRTIDLIEKHSAKSGLRGKINAKCIECIYEENAGTGSWRKQVEGCTAKSCPLYAVRPLTDGALRQV